MSIVKTYGAELAEALGLPANTRKFVLTVAVDEPVICTAEYYPKIDERLPPILKQIKLVELPVDGVVVRRR